MEITKMTDEDDEKQILQCKISDEEYKEQHELYEKDVQDKKDKVKALISEKTYNEIIAMDSYLKDYSYEINGTILNLLENEKLTKNGSLLKFFVHRIIESFYMSQIQYNDDIRNSVDDKTKYAMAIYVHIIEPLYDILKSCACIKYDAIDEFFYMYFGELIEDIFKEVYFEEKFTNAFDVIFSSINAIFLYHVNRHEYGLTNTKNIKVSFIVSTINRIFNENIIEKTKYVVLSEIGKEFARVRDKCTESFTKCYNYKKENLDLEEVKANIAKTVAIKKSAKVKYARKRVAFKMLINPIEEYKHGNYDMVMNAYIHNNSIRNKEDE